MILQAGLIFPSLPAKPASDPAGAESEKKDKEKVSKTEKEPEDLSEEDKKLKEELELCVTRLQDSDDKVLINNKIGSILDLLLY